MQDWRNPCSFFSPSLPPFIQQKAVCIEVWVLGIKQWIKVLMEETNDKPKKSNIKCVRWLLCYEKNKQGRKGVLGWDDKRLRWEATFEQRPGGEGLSCADTQGRSTEWYWNVVKIVTTLCIFCHTHTHKWSHTWPVSNLTRSLELEHRKDRTGLKGKQGAVWQRKLLYT